MIQSASAHSAGPVYGFVSLWCVGLIIFSFCDQILCEKPTCEDRFQIIFISCKIQPGASKMLPKWSQKGPTWSQQGPKWSQKGPTWSQQGPKWSQKGPTLTKRAPKGDQNASQNPPTHGVSKPLGGEVSSPLPPSALPPHPAEVCPQSA